MMKKTFLGLMILAGLSICSAQVSIGVRIGPPPPPRVIRVQPPRPGPDYMWVDGYWFADGGRYRWHDGYWTRPPYGGARWVSPRYESEHFYGGYWDGDRGRFEHDHRWDRDRRYRDYREHDRDHDRDRDHR
jgi:hypothetical protein